MRYRNATRSIVLAAALLTVSVAEALDESKYPDWSGKWRRAEGGGPRYDPSKPRGRAQEPPLKPEYMAIFEASLAAQDAGGQGNDPTYKCLPVGMPRQMASGFPIEIVLTAKTIFILYENSIGTTRRIHFDGRDWPKDEQPSFAGTSIGTWSDSDGDGRLDTLDVETRNLKGPRAFDNAGTPLHEDNQTVVKERLYLDKTDKNILHNEMTTFDNALTRPWAVKKRYRRDAAMPWTEENCAESNNHVEIGKEGYFLSADGYLMPTRKGQPPPDLRYFPPTPK
jgi:hypothetical protein